MSEGGFVVLGYDTCADLAPDECQIVIGSRQVLVPSEAAAEMLRARGVSAMMNVVDDSVSESVELEGAVYCAPGAPVPGDRLAAALQRRAAAEGLRVRVIQGMPLGWSMQRLLQQGGAPTVDAAPLAVGPASLGEVVAAGRALWVESLWSEDDVRDVGEALLRQFPSSHRVYVVGITTAADQKADLRPIRLDAVEEELPPGGAHLLWVPSIEAHQGILDRLSGVGQAAAGLAGVVQRLRGPGGCPWDRQQTHSSLRPFLLEECHELLEVLAGEDGDKLREELGDVLLQVMLNAVIAEGDGRFLTAEVMTHLKEKMVRRHPHVFGALSAETADEVETNWEKIKREDRESPETSVLDGIPETLPALLQAEKVQSVVSRVGFDWDDIRGPLDKIREETGEFADAVTSQDGTGGEELGDLLFSVVNAARFLSLSAEAELLAAIAKFRRRFSIIENHARRRGVELAEMGLEEMDRIWEAYKGCDKGLSNHDVERDRTRG